MRCPFNPFPADSDWGRKLDRMWRRDNAVQQDADAIEFLQMVASREWKSINRRAALSLDDETIEDLQNELAVSLIMDAAWPDGDRAMAHAILKRFALVPREAITEISGFLDSIEGAGYGGMASFEIARDHIRSAIPVRMREN